MAFGRVTLSLANIDSPRPGAAMRTRVFPTILRLFWTGGEHITIGRMLAFGALTWGVYSAVSVVINGVVLDEVLIPAQIITGAVHYPPGHPHQIYYPRVFSLSNYLAAAIWALAPDPLLISAIRNFLFLFLSVLVPFAFAVIITRRPWWGHVASTLVVCGAYLPFQGLYPLWVFPDFYSQGHVGLNVALLIVALLLARCWRLGGFLLGLLPCVHLGMTLVIWPWSGWYLFFASERPRGKNRFSLIVATCLGLAISVVLAIIIFTRMPIVDHEPPYDAQANGEIIRKQFLSATDRHRQPIPLWTFGYLINPAAFFIISALLLWNTKRQPTEGAEFDYKAVLWIVLLGGGGVALHVWGPAIPIVRGLITFSY